jgi:hypothetical protein
MPHSTKTGCYSDPDLGQQANPQILDIGKRGSKLRSELVGNSVTRQKQQ